MSDRTRFPANRLEGTEEKFRNRESRPEDLQIIAELKDMVSEREALVKKLVVGTVAEGGVKLGTELLGVHCSCISPNLLDPVTLLFNGLRFLDRAGV